MDGSINFIGSLSGSIDEGGGGGGNVYDVKVKTSLNYESVVDEDDKTAYIDLSGYATKSELSGFVTSKALTIILNDYVTDSELSTELTSYQPKLTAGENITIENNVISASGGGGGLNYSTTEQDTGLLWIDGTSHIYQKSIISNFGSSQYCDIQISSDNVIVLDFELFAITEGFIRWIPIPIGQNMSSDYMRVIEGYSQGGTGLRISKSHPTNFGYNTNVYLTARYIYNTNV